nr:reverse transcriptase domain-containing protein [Tanacetum cinerariifolium]
MTKVNDFIAMDSEAQESSTKRTAKHLESDISKKQKVLIEATPISSRSPTIIDYKIHKEGKKTYFKIIRADGNSQVYQTFEKLFKNFNREDLEVLWDIVKDRFKKEKPVDDTDNILFRTLKTMFEHLVEDTIWKYQQGLAKMDYDVERAYDLLRFIKKQLMEGLGERMELDLEARLMGEALILNRSQDYEFRYFLELKDLNEPLELRNNENKDLDPTIEGGEIFDEPMVDVVKISMLNLTPDAGIESIFETTSQMDVSTPTLVAPLPVSAPTLTPATIATVTTIQQALTPPTTAPSTSLQDLPNFSSLFGFDHRLKTLKENFSELRDEAQAENDEFFKIIDENMQKIIKEQVKEQVKTSYAVAAVLSEMELKKILIEKMEGNKSIHRSNEQKNLYKALVEAYESDKIILDTYEDTVMLKRRQDDDADKDEEASAGSDRGSKRRREGKEPESASDPKEKTTRSAGKSTQGSKSRQTSASEFATEEEPMLTTHEMEEPSHPEFETGADDQPIIEPSQHPEWFSQQKKPPTPDRDWNKTLSATHRSIQPWISELAKQSDSRSAFNELMDTPMDFSAFLMNRLKVDTLTPELLAAPTYELICKRLVELEFFLEELYKATTYQLDWVNPEGKQYPHNLLKPLPLIPNSRGLRVIPFYHFINNDLEYLHGGALSRKYTTSVTKTKAAYYGNIKWIEDLVPRTMWIQEPVGYDKHALWGISHWGRKRQQFYGFAVNQESARDVYSKRRIIAVTELKIVEWHNYKQLDWITVRRDDDKLYKFKEGDFERLRIQDIEDMLLNLRKSDKDRVAAMIQAIDKQLKTMRIMRSFERKLKDGGEGSTAHIQPPVTPILEPDVPKTLPKPNIPYPSRLNDHKLRKKAMNQLEKFFQIFQDLHFDISFTDALLLMPKFASTINSLLTNKDKLFELAKIPLNENCSAMLLKKLPKKLGDLEKFLIPCDFPGMD